MSFRFEITEIFPARRPIVLLCGWLREGHVKMSEKISVPYRDGSSILCAIVGIEALYKSVEFVSVEEVEEQIGIAITGLNCLEVEKDSIAIGSVAVGIKRIS